MSAPRRRPAASWPAALLPGALLVALLTAGAGSMTTSGEAEPDAKPPITDLHVVDHK